MPCYEKRITALRTLFRLSGSRTKADPFGKRDKFRDGQDLHFDHHLLPVSFDGEL